MTSVESGAGARVLLGRQLKQFGPHGACGWARRRTSELLDSGLVALGPVPGWWRSSYVLTVKVDQPSL